VITTQRAGAGANGDPAAVVGQAQHVDAGPGFRDAGRECLERNVRSDHA
jgi:hypothetical protein